MTENSGLKKLWGLHILPISNWRNQGSNPSFSHPIICVLFLPWWFSCPKPSMTWVSVVYACSPNCTEGRDQENHDSKTAQASSSQDPILKILNTKKGWQSGSSSRVPALSSNPSTAKKKNFKRGSWPFSVGADREGYIPPKPTQKVVLLTHSVLIPAFFQCRMQEGQAVFAAQKAWGTNMMALCLPPFAYPPFHSQSGWFLQKVPGCECTK
jgi:hypothetical protein